jgi:parallel beta-helix repeat protein
MKSPFWFLLALGAVVGHAAELYVGPAGQDANPGSLAAPWKTLQRAANAAQPGDTVYVRGGTYAERVKFNVSGTASAPIVFTNYAGETPVFDLNGVAPTAASQAIFHLVGRSYVTIRGFELRNLRTTSTAVVPMGIHVEGGGRGVRLEGNRIHRIEQNYAVKRKFTANAHGIAVYGNAATPIEDLTIDGNEVSFLRLGASEAVVINGNVNGFAVTNNLVHDCNNIGIDIIGYEGTSPVAALDRARNGRVEGNTVYRIDATTNPAYGGSFTTGGGERAAAGIYVDGGTQVVIERNHVHSSNYGIELASEHANGRTDFVTIRNNLIRNNQMAGVILGGYDHKRGATENCVVANNTIYQNDTATGYAGQVNFQFYVRNNAFVNNVVWAAKKTRELLVHYPDASGATAAQKEFGVGNVFSHNQYFAVGGTPTNIVFEAYTRGAHRTFTGLRAWQASGLVSGDVASSVGDPRFAVAVPAASAGTGDFLPAANSPLVDAGSPTTVPAPGELDLAGNARLNGLAVDRGALER